MKDLLIEKQERERECPNCFKTVWMNWGESPNLHCKECGFEADMEDCPECGSLMAKDNDYGICEECWERKMRE